MTEIDQEAEQSAGGATANVGTRRQYFRVKTRMAIRTRVLQPEEADRLRLDIAERKPSSEPKLDPRLERWLERIERKLDEIRAQFDPEVERPLGVADLREIEISGSGLAWRGAPRHEAGAFVRAVFELPRPLCREVVVLGRVVKRHGEDPSREPVAIAFEAISEEDRDAIVRHCLDVERRNIQLETGKRDTANRERRE